MKNISNILCLSLSNKCTEVMWWMCCLVLCVCCPCSIYSCSCIFVVLCYFFVSAVVVKTRLISACDGLFKNSFYLVSFHLCRASLCSMWAFILFMWKHISPWTRTKGMKYEIHCNWKWSENNSVRWDDSKFRLQVNTVRFTHLTFDSSQKCHS